MATINAAAAMLVGMRRTIAAVTILVAGALAGCTGGSGNLLTADAPLGANNSLTAPSTAPRARVAIAPVIGAPAQIAEQIVGKLTTETAKSNIVVAKSATEQVDYTVRGYIVAAREASGTKVSYIWDVTNPTGARVHRITGEEVISGAGAGDPWAAVSPQLVEAIATKTSQQLDSWMPQKAAAPRPQQVSVPVADAAGGAGAQVANVGTASLPAGTGAATASSAATGSIGRPGSMTALVPSVAGAPGDGSQSLAAAMRNELLRNDIKPTPPGAPAYRVEGRVKMGPAAEGKQPIKIEWVVRDPKGAKLGTVSQENQVPAGSLNGNWGQTASLAAAAATQGVLKLLPQRTAAR